MKYIKPFIIEIFAALLFQDQPIEIEKDCWWEEEGNIADDGEELKPVPMIFFPHFERYVSESNLQDVIIITDNYDNNVITLKKTHEAKIKLKKFLQKYLDAYRRGELEPYAYVNYFCYQENLSYMKNVLFELSGGFRQKTIVLHSYRFQKTQTKHYTYPLSNERIKLAEFLLDIYFHPKFKELIKINSCKIEYGGYHLLGTASLIVTITLLEHPDVIYNTLSTQLVFEKPDLPTAKKTKMGLEFSHILENDADPKKFYILLAGKKINLTKKEYALIHDIINKKEKISPDMKRAKGTKYSVNKKAKEALKDNNFELLNYDGSYYSWDKEKVYYSNY